MSRKAVLLAQLEAIRKRLDERSRVQPGFSVLRNEGGPYRKVIIGTGPVYQGQPNYGAASLAEFNAIERQLTPMLRELGAKISPEDDGIFGWVLNTTVQDTRLRPDMTHPVTSLSDHPYRAVAMAVELFMASIRAAEDAIDDLVTLDQVAPLVGQSKRTLERYLKQGLIPEPDFRGGSGKAHKWLWGSLRPALAEFAGRELPEKFPGSRIV